MEIEKATISTHNGSTFSQEHNRRDIAIVSKESHIRPNGEYEVWRDEPVRDAYHRLFDQALQEYNDKQTRADRKIKSYYDHIARDSRKRVAYEMIVGIYQQNCVISDEKKKEILRKFADTWNERNKVGDNGLELIGCYWHNDEDGQMHIHCDYVAVSSSCKVGLSTQSSLTKALEDIGFTTQGKQTAQMAWEARENQFLGQLCMEQNILVIHPGGDRKEHLQTAEYKAVKQIETLEEQKKQLLIEVEGQKLELKSVKKEIEDAVIHRDSLKSQNSLLDAVKSAYAEQEDREITILEHQSAKIKKGEVQRPEAVLISKDDFDYLVIRAKARDFVLDALDKLQKLGNKLMKAVSGKHQIDELQYLLKRESDEREKVLSQFRDLRFWCQKFTDSKGHAIWEYYTYSKQQEILAEQRQAQEIAEKAYEQEMQEIDEREQ